MEIEELAREVANLLTCGMNARALIAARKHGQFVDDSMLEQVLRDLAHQLLSLTHPIGMTMPQLPQDALEKAKLLLDALDQKTPAAAIDDRILDIAMQCLATSPA